MSPEAIRTQLDRIRTSPTFAGNGILGPVLGFLVEETLAGHDVDDYTVGVRGLGYPEDFDPAENPAVFVLMRRARRALAVYYADRGARDPIRIEIPAGRYSPSFLPNV